MAYWGCDRGVYLEEPRFARSQGLLDPLRLANLAREHLGNSGTLVRCERTDELEVVSAEREESVGVALGVRKGRGRRDGAISPTAHGLKSLTACVHICRINI